MARVVLGTEEMQFWAEIRDITRIEPVHGVRGFDQNMQSKIS